MSYARFGADGSDVYVYGDSDNHLVCCFCALNTDPNARVRFATVAEMVAHLEQHRSADHAVPQYTIDDILADAADYAPQEP